MQYCINTVGYWYDRAMNETSANRVREQVVDDSHAGQRVDNYLMRVLKGVPKTRIYRLLRKGEVRVNKGRVKPNHRLASGDVVRIPPIRTGGGEGGAKPADKVLARVERSIIYEDKGFVILNKPSGLAVHGGSGLSYGLIEALRALRPEAPYLELAHRLDRETSGCLVIAKKRSALRAFQELLRGDGVDKRYLCLVRGCWQGGPRKVDAPLRKNTLRSGERLVKVADDGKASLTVLKPVSIYGNSTLLEAKLVTGRTHQVRVHTAWCGHPIAGDEKYGDEGFNRAMRERGLRRLFLHAASLSFTLPSGQEVFVQAPLDDELRDLLTTLESE